MVVNIMRLVAHIRTTLLKVRFPQLGIVALLAWVLCVGVSAIPAQTTEAKLSQPGATAQREMLHIASNYAGRMASSPMESAAADYLTKRFTEMGYKPRKIRFDTSFDFVWERNRTVDITSTNVIAEHPGRSGQQIIIGAHYDSRIPRSNDEILKNIGGPRLQGLDDKPDPPAIVPWRSPSLSTSQQRSTLDSIPTTPRERVVAPIRWHSMKWAFPP